MVTVLAVDPGSEQSAGVLYAPLTGVPVKWAKVPNAEMLRALDTTKADVLVVEMVASYGMAVGAEVFETCVWIGRFVERWLQNQVVRPEPLRIFRREVKLHLTGSTRAKDTNVRQALIDRYGPGREKAIGRKASPGPLYGMKQDCWQALALAITATEADLDGHTRPATPTVPGSSDEREEEPQVRLCQRLASLIRANDPKAEPKPESERWLRDMRLLIGDRNGDVAEVETIIEWCQADSFWRSNILSPAKLRKQFTALVLRRSERVATSSNVVQMRSPVLEYMDRWKQSPEYQGGV